MRIMEGSSDVCSSDLAVPDQDGKVRRAQIRVAFFALPDEQRAALHLVAIEGLPDREAAETLGVPIGTLMSRLGRAREALRAFEQGGEAGAGRAPSFSRKLRLVGGSDDPAG